MEYMENGTLADFFDLQANRKISDIWLLQNYAL
eukprot:CAMPEP_0116884824 /NCGR_PEP_ID=MMETSP0463-20121206/17865_1 /TAXON_ID=181622 /ORGANISM="Strombidinopsis sp, Strain SopsisLIS2011" /LENGTH=32 /DNA_ID= /DNA_START= /DNA_END= /DNA_ORIENTATION=